MSWRDSLQRVTHPDGRKLIGASFRGVPFFVSTSERVGGRRSVTHEFPLRDDPYVEDLGRRARVFSVEGYVLGDEYVRQRDNLLSALEDNGEPGELIHPYYGVKRAICTDVTMRETVADGGMVVFSITFAEAPDRPTAPTETVDAGELIDSTAAAAQVSTRAEFDNEYDVDDLPTWALDSAANALTAASDKLYTTAGPLVKNTQGLAKLNQEVTILKAQASSLVRDPDEMFDGFIGALTALTESLIDVPGAVITALIDTYGADLGSPVSPTTPTREQEADNQAALQRALRRMIAIEAVRMAPKIPYESQDDAIAARDSVLAILDEQILLADVTAYPDLHRMRAAFTRALPGDEQRARILTVERRVPIPSLLLSHQLYGSVEQELDLVARNKAPHPGFMSGTFKVLSDG